MSTPVARRIPKNINEMSVDEVKAYIIKEVERYRREADDRKYWSLQAQHASINGFRVKMKRVLEKIYPRNSEEFKTAVKKFPTYTLNKKTTDDEIKSFCDYLLKPEECDSPRIYLANIYLRERREYGNG